jgi:GT2 family glycosyltransferase
LENLCRFAENNPSAIPCCSVLGVSDGGQQALCGYRLHYFKWYIEPLWKDLSEINNPDFTLPCDLNGGHGVLLPRKLFERNPGVIRPTLFPHYAGDFDFYFQAKKMGFIPVSVGGARIVNDAASSGLLSGRRLSHFSQIWGYLSNRRSPTNLRDRPMLALLNFPFGLNFIWALIFLITPVGCAAMYKLRSSRA